MDGPITEPLHKKAKPLLMLGPPLGHCPPHFQVSLKDCSKLACPHTVPDPGFPSHKEPVPPSPSHSPSCAHLSWKTSSSTGPLRECLGGDCALLEASGLSFLSLYPMNSAKCLGQSQYKIYVVMETMDLPILQCRVIV